MHPFHLSQVIFFGSILLLAIGLYSYEKIRKQRLPKMRIFVYSMTIVLLLSVLVSIYFYIRYDYSLIFPADYFQPHDLFLAMVAFIFLAIKLTPNKKEEKEFNQRDKILICCCLTLVSLLIVVPTSEKIADRYHYIKAADKLADEEEEVHAAITHDVSSCREDPEYRKTYQAFECETDGSRLYYMFAENTTAEKQQVVIHLSLLDKKEEEIKEMTSQEMTLKPDEVEKVIFDSDVFHQPAWMQHSFHASEKFLSYQYTIDLVGGK